MTRVALAVITHQRPDQLAALLDSLQSQGLDEPDPWQVEVVIVDNDAEGSAGEVVRQASGPYPMTYVIEPNPGIPAARQRSVDECAEVDALVFVDDDEVAPQGWLQRLLDTWLRTGADVVTGPVQGILPSDAPGWAQHSDAYSSVDRHRSGARLTKAYTNNTLVSREVLESITPAFHPAFRFTGSSDLHFFLRVARAGFTIVWDNEALVRETVPHSRLTLGWLVRRGYRSGAGDTISRRLILGARRSVPQSAVLGLARVLSGLALLVAGIIDPARRIKGLRRIASGIGSWAGLFGLNYAEYRR